MSGCYPLRLCAPIAALLLFTISAQAQWVEQVSGFPQPNTYIYSLDAVDENVAWAVAGRIPVAPETGFTRTTDGGATWTAGTITEDPNLAVVDISALDVDTAWTALDSFTGSPRIYKTTDGGTTWTWQETAFPSSSSFANIIHFYDADHGLTIGDSQGGYFEIYTTTDGGTNWIRVPETSIPPPLPDEYGYITCAAYWQDIVWFGTSQGRVFKSTNRGIAWTVSDTGVGPVYDIGGIAFRDANHGLVAAHYAGGQRWIIQTSDGGETWFSFASPSVPGEILTPRAVPGTEMFVITSEGTFGPGGPGSAYSLDDGENWILIDTEVHGPADFVGPDVGWSGGVNAGPTEGGMWKWVGTTSVVSKPGAVPHAQPMLAQNYPNPFNPRTFIAFELPGASHVRLRIYDIAGRQVRTLVDTQLVPDAYSVMWDGRDDGGQAVGSGVYYYRIETGAWTATRRMVFVK